jgi:hypothetical protein
MPTQNALAAVRLTSVRRRPPQAYHVTLEVWSHSYDHPDPVSRSAFIRTVSLTGLTTTANMTNVTVKDRYGVDQSSLMVGSTNPTNITFDGYREVDTGRPCQPGFPAVLWGVYSGIYDQRCLADPVCDALRLQTLATWPGLTGFNYISGPVTFDFDVGLAAPPKTVRLTMFFIGGNQGNPAQRFNNQPSETFTIEFP